MNRYKIEITIKVSEYITQEDVEDWAKFQTHYSCQISGENPLVDEDIEPKSFAIRKV